jgi:hypothetical protein
VFKLLKKNSNPLFQFSLLNFPFDRPVISAPASRDYLPFDLTPFQIRVIRGTLQMDSNLGDALSGLLLLHGANDSNNDPEDSSPTPTTNDIDLTPISNGSSSTPTSNDSMDVIPTSPAAVTERRK